MKLNPIIKLIGNGTDSADIKYTFSFSELFCIPIIKTENSKKLQINEKNNLLNGKTINLKFNIFETYLNYK